MRMLMFLPILRAELVVLRRLRQSRGDLPHAHGRARLGPDSSASGRRHRAVHLARPVLPSQGGAHPRAADTRLRRLWRSRYLARAVCSIGSNLALASLAAAPAPKGVVDRLAPCQPAHVAVSQGARVPDGHQRHQRQVGRVLDAVPHGACGLCRGRQRALLLPPATPEPKIPASSKDGAPAHCGHW